MIQKLIGALVLIAFLLSGLPSALAGAAIIGFDGITASGGFTGPLTEDGFTYSEFGAVGLFGSINHGNPAPEMEGGANTGGGVLQIVSETAGQAFLFVGMDIAHFDSQHNTHEIIVAGFLDSLHVATETFITTVDPSSSWGPYTTVTSTAGQLLDGAIDELRISLPGLSTATEFWYTRTDNIQLDSIPEPATLALMGLGLAGIGYRRKQKLAA